MNSATKPSAAEVKKKFVKKSTAEEDGRRRREATMIKIRKDKREEGLQKRRMVCADLAGSADPSASGSSSAAGATSEGASNVPTEINVAFLDSYCEG
jgi:hypothetical protein